MEMELLLDDYKIYVEHELNALKNKLETIKTNVIIQELPPKGFNQFRNDFYKTINNIYRQLKNTNNQAEDNLFIIENKINKIVTTINNDNIMQVRYIHVLFIINIWIVVLTNIIWIIFSN